MIKKLGSLTPLLIVNFIGTLGVSLVMPFLVFLVKRFGGNEVIYGIVGATYSASQFVGAPILGKLSDHMGRKRILLVSQAGTLISWLIFLIALYIPMIDLWSNQESSVLGQLTLTLPLLLLFISRVLDGLTGGNISVANAYLADISTDENRNENFGKMSASSNLGFVIGPMIAGLLGATVLGEKLPVISAVMIAFIGLLAIQFLLKESHTAGIMRMSSTWFMRKVLGLESKCAYEKKLKKHQVSPTFCIPGVKSMLFLYFIIFLAFNVFYAAFPIHAVDGLSWNSVELGIYFSVLSGSMVLVQGVLLPAISKYFSEIRLILMGTLGLCVSFALLLRQDLFSLYISALFFAGGNGLMWPSFMSILGNLGEKKQQGGIQGLATSMGSLASILGLLGGGFMYKMFGAKSFLVGALLFFIVFLCSLTILRSISSSKQTMMT